MVCKFFRNNPAIYVEITLPFTFYLHFPLFAKEISILRVIFCIVFFHSGRPKLYTILAFLSVMGLRVDPFLEVFDKWWENTVVHLCTLRMVECEWLSSV